jgi:hypothetical protein
VLSPLGFLRVLPLSAGELERRRVDEPPRQERQHARRDDVERLELEAVVHVELFLLLEVEVPLVLGPVPHLAANRQRPAEERGRELRLGTLLVQPLGEVRSVGGAR